MKRSVGLFLAVSFVVAVASDIVLWRVDPGWAPLTGGGALIATYVGALFTLAALILPLFDENADLSNGPEPLVRIASRQRSRWLAELKRRELGSPKPLEVQWQRVGFNDGEDWLRVPEPIYTPSEDSEAARPLPHRLDSYGTSSSLANAYLDSAAGAPARATRQLAVLGKPGSGKTVLLMQLCLTLLDDLSDQVPYMLNIAGWNPRVPLLSWLAHQIVRDCLNQTNKRLQAEAVDNVTDLLTQGRIVPLLDGLDEMDETHRSGAIDALRQGGVRTPLVFTCRTEQFNAIVSTDGALASVDHVELQDVPLSEALRYLAGDSRPEIAAAWAAVRAQPLAAPQLETLFATPLTVGLARAVLNGAEDIARLAAPDGFTSTQLAQDFLTDSFLDKSAPVNTSDLDPGRSRDRYIRHLAVLARMMDADSETRYEFRWWRMWSVIAPRTARVVFVLAIFVVALLFSSLLFHQIQRRQHADLITALTTATCLLFAVVAAVSGVPGRPNKTILRFAGTSEGDFARSFMPPALFSSVFAASVYGAAGRTGLAMIVSTAVFVVFGLGFGLYRLSAPLNRDQSASSPGEELAADRRSALIRSVVLFILSGSATSILFSVTEPAGIAIGSGLYCATFLTLGGLLATPWTWYLASLAWMASRAQLPWRFQRFLAHAYDTEVLRQAGTVFQFRHRNFQQRLLDRSGPRGTTLRGRSRTRVGAPAALPSIDRSPDEDAASRA